MKYSKKIRRHIKKKNKYIGTEFKKIFNKYREEVREIYNHRQIIGMFYHFDAFEYVQEVIAIFLDIRNGYMSKAERFMIIKIRKKHYIDSQVNLIEEKLQSFTIKF